MIAGLGLGRFGSSSDEISDESDVVTLLRFLDEVRGHAWLLFTGYNQPHLAADQLPV